MTERSVDKKTQVRSTEEALSTERALKLALEALEETRNALAWFYDSYPQDVTKKGNELLPHAETVLAAIREALAQAPTEQEQPAQVAEPRKAQSAVKQQEPVAFLANGTRFKISYDSRQSGGQIHGIPPELGGRWVAFVAADDDCHLKLTSPPASKPWVGLTDEDFNTNMFSITSLGVCDIASMKSIAKDVEAKLREKNT